MGGNNYGQLGIGTTKNVNVPVPVPVAGRVLAVAAGDAHTMFITPSGSNYSLNGMGKNNYGQLGNGDPQGTNVLTPQLINNYSNVVALAAGSSHTLLLQRNGPLWGMGYNADGELGNGTMNNTNVPLLLGKAYSPAGVFSGSSAYTTYATGILPAPFITTQPVSQTVAPGGTVAFTVSSSGTNTLAYQWYLNGSAVSGATGTNATLTLTNVQTARAGYYTVVVTNAYGSVTSIAAWLNVSGPAYISSQPAGQTVLAGGTATFTVTAGGTTPVAYQWYFNGSAISGAAGSNAGFATINYTLTGLTTNNTGNYLVVVTNAAGSSTSIVASLTVWEPVHFAVQLTNQTVVAGAAVNLSSSAAGTGPFNFQWYKNGGQLAGATNSVLTLTNAGVANSGSYYVVVTSPYSFGISPPALLLVGNPSLLACGSDQYGQLGNWPITENLPLAVASNVVVAAGGGNAAMFIDNNGTLWGTGQNYLGQLGLGYLSQYLYPVIPPQVIASNVVAVAAGEGDTLYIDNRGTLWGTGYNYFGQLGNGTMTNTDVPVAVASNVVALAVGGYHTMFLQTNGMLWGMGYNRFGQLGNGTTNDSNVPVAVASNVVAVTAGWYHTMFIRTNGTLWGMGENNYGQLGNGDISGTNVLTPQLFTSNVAAVAAGGNHTLFIQPNGTLQAMGWNIYGQLGNGTTNNAYVPVAVASNVVAVAAGYDYTLFMQTNGKLWGMGDNSGVGLYSDGGALGNGGTDNTAVPVPMAGPVLVAGIFSGSSSSASFVVGLEAPVVATAPGSQTLLAGGTANFTVTAAGTAPLAYQWYFNGIAVAGAVSTNVSLTNVQAANAGNYTVVVTNAYGSVTSSVAALNVDAPVYVITPPTNQTVVPGGTATLTVTIGGTAPLAYQWYFNGIAVAGAVNTNATLTLTNVQAACAGSYTVVVTNAVSSVTSSVALYVDGPPFVITPPTSQVLAAGGAATFTVTAGGAAPLAYQWYFNGSAISGASGVNPGLTPINYTLTGLTTNNTGNYQVVLTNAYGGSTSSVAVLTVINITSQPANRTVAAGGTVNLSVAIGGTGPQTYQWFGNGAQVVGATNSVLSVTNSGSYYVAVTSPNGVAISFPALVKVGSPNLSGWGENVYGQLGNGTTTNSAVPVTVTNSVVAATAGFHHAMFIQANGSLEGMGYNGYGQLGNGVHFNTNWPVTVAADVVAVVAGEYHTLFIQTNGTLWGMGYNGYGQMGNGDFFGTNVFTPQLIASNVVAVAAGAYHTMFVQANGTLWGMGQNNYGQLGNGTTTNTRVPVVVATNVVTVAAGGDYTLFMQNNGTLWGMGDNALGELGNGTSVSTNVPVMVATNVVAVAAGAGHTVFIRANATLWGTGNNAYGQLGNGDPFGTNVFKPQLIASNVVTVAAGAYHTMFMQTNGILFEMGQNNYGQLGNGITSNSLVPVPSYSSLAGVFSGSSAVTTYAVGYQAAPSILTQPTNQTVLAGGTAVFSVAVAGTSFAYQWFVDGAPLSGANGTNLNPNLNLNFTLTNVQVPNAGNYTIVVTNAYGSVTSSIASLTVLGPAYIASQPTNQTVAAGGTVNLSVIATGPGPLAYQWFNNGAKVLGATNSLLSMTNAGLKNSGSYVVAVTSLYGVTISRPALVSVGNPDLLAWGLNGNGQLGNATTNNAKAPAYVANNVVAGSVGASTMTYVDNNGTLWGTGNGIYGQLDTGNLDSQLYFEVTTSGGVFDVIQITTPQVIASNVVAVAEGNNYTMYVDNKGTLWGTGDDTFGQLGLDPRQGYLISVYGFLSRSYLFQDYQVANNVVAVAAGALHTLFVQANGTLWGMGNNGSGQVGAGTNAVNLIASNVVAAAAGLNHTLFIQTNGTLWGMGYNGYGQLGNGTTISTNVPVTVASNVLAVAGGGNHTMFIDNNGTLWGMGQNNYGQLGNGTTNIANVPVAVASNVVAVAAGLQHTLFMRTNGTLWGMGYNRDGELGNGTTNNTAVPVQVSGLLSLAGIFIGNNSGSSYAEGYLQAPAIMVQPANQMPQPGGTATFTVAATGTAPLAYQWYFGGSAVGGPTGTNATLTLTNVLAANTGSYAVVITNAYGSVTSSLATLALDVPLYLTNQPVSQSVQPGATATFTVVAVGTAPLAYQWYFNGSAISGPAGTNATLTLTNMQAANSGNYQVYVTNAYGSVTSSLAVLTLAVLPTVTSQPANWVWPAGGTVNLAAPVAGTGPLTYQWYKNGAPVLNGVQVAGANSPSLTFTEGVNGSGSYYEVVTSPYGVAISRPALVLLGNPYLMDWGFNGNGQLGNGTTISTMVPLWAATNTVVVAAGNAHAMSIDSKGTLWGTGGNSSGQLGNGTTISTSVPVAVASNVVAVAAGQAHTLFMQTNGTLWAMGDNTYGQLGNGDPTGTNVLTPQLIGSNVVAVAAGQAHTLFMQGNGLLWAMGENNYGQLGNGDPTGTNVVTPQVIASNVVAVAAGQAHTLFVQGNGLLWAMGENNYGQLGNGDPTGTNAYTPQLVGSNVTAVAAGAGHTMFMQTNGTLWGMGENNYGQLGNGTTISTIVPVMVTTNVSAVVAGPYHTLFMQANGTLWGMGYNADGELGNGTTNNTNVPVLTGNVNSLAGIFGGSSAAFNYEVGLPVVPVMTTQPANGTLLLGATATFTSQAIGSAPLSYRWYFNGSAISGSAATNATLTLTNAQLANTGNYQVVVTNAYGSLTSSVAALYVVAPVFFTSLPTNQTVAAGGTVNLSVTAGGGGPLTYQWFKNGAQVVGATNTVLTITNAGFANCGSYYVAVTGPCLNDLLISYPALVSVGNPGLLDWGANSQGQLGLSNRINYITAPTNMAISVVTAAGGSSHGMLIDNNGTLWGMGMNTYGQLGNGNASGTNVVTPQIIASNVMAVSAGLLHTMFIKTNGTLWGTGYNNYGELGNGNSSGPNVYTPQLIATNVVAVSAGRFHTMFIQANGTLWGTGLNQYSQLGNGVFNGPNVGTPQLIASNVVAVSAGEVHTVFVDDNNTLWGMGQSIEGELGGSGYHAGNFVYLPTPVASNVVAVSAGDRHTVFVQPNGTLWGMGYNYNGQLGNGDLTGSNVFNAQLIASNVLSVSAGAYYTMFIQTNGALWGMGDNSTGQLGVGTTTNSAVPVSVGGVRLASIFNGSSAYGNYAVGVVLPYIVTQPTNLGVLTGGTVAFTVAAGGAGPLSYQWQFNGVNLTDGGVFSGSALTNLVLTGATSNNVGSYDVVVSDPYASVTSSVATLTIAFAPAITNQPQPASQTVLSGQTVAFSVGVTGTGPISYQWQLNGINLVKDPIITVAGNGSYGPSGDGALATNTTLYNPSGVAVDAIGNVYFSDQNNHRIRKVGANGIIKTVAGNGTAGFSGDGGSATNASLYLPSGVALDASGNLYFSDEYNQRIRKVGTNGIITTVAGNGTAGFSGDGGSATNASFRYPLGVAVDIGTRTTLADKSNSRIRKVNANGIITTVAGNGTFGLSGDGGTATSAGLNLPCAVVLDTAGNLYIADTSDNRIRKVGTNGVITTVVGDGVGRYFGEGGTALSSSLYNPNGICLDTYGNLFIADTSNQRIREWIAAGPVQIAGPMITLAGATSALSGNYQVIVSSLYGSVTSSVATLNIGFPPAITNQPVAQTVINGSNAVFSVAATGVAPLAYQWQFNGTNLTDGGEFSGSATARLALTGASDRDVGQYEVIITNALGSVTSSVAALTIVYPPGITNQPVAQTVINGSNAAFSVAATGTAPLAYRWQFRGTNLTDGGVYSGSGTTNLVVTGASTNNAGAYAVVITNAYGRVTSSVAALTIVFPPAIASQPVAQTVINGSNAVFKVATTGTGPFSYQWQFNGVNLADAGEYSGSATTNLVVSGATTNDAGYYGVIVTSPWGSVTSSVVALTIVFPPAIANQPVAQTVINGSNAVFSVMATGTGPLSYQWQFNGVNLADRGEYFGSATTNLVVTGATTNDAGAYAVVVASPWGSVTSSVAALTIVYPPSITNQPVAQTVINGSNAVFSVAATGTGSMTYQWQFNGVNLTDGGEYSGSATTNLVVTGVTTNDAGAYAVIVTSPWGSVTSSVVALNIVYPPGIVNQPVDQTVMNGSNAVFSVAATGTGSLTYQWQFNGVNLMDGGEYSGSATANLVVTGVATNDAGLYEVIITSPWGRVTSSVAALTIVYPPAIANQPVAQTVLNGSTAVFSVAATGTGPLSYQWQFNGVNLADGGKISGSATANVVEAGATANDAGLYEVIVTSPWGSVTSSVVALTVSSGLGNFKVSYANGVVTVTGSGGIPGSKYLMQRSQDLITWVTLSVITVGSDGTVATTDSFGDLGGATPPGAFYRVIYQPGSP